jgi:hypothetical protein
MQVKCFRKLSIDIKGGFIEAVYFYNPCIGVSRVLIGFSYTGMSCYRAPC